jgi:glycosyltransferase involved in cell wall biosynthesis
MLPAFKMRILIFHGYLLRGTGSNVYNAELARALLAAGHDVDLICQEKHARELEWVDAVGSWDQTGALEVEEFGFKRDDERGRCTVFLPPIADQLPVYVQDNYTDFVARTFDQFDDDELEFYISRNVMAVEAVVERARPDYALANHMVMGPYILSQALEDVPYVAKIHGSAMEYIVRPHPRFLPYARTGVGEARAVLVGSRHIAERTWDTLRIPELENRIYLGPPGVDIDRFRPAKNAEVAIENLADAGERVLGLPRLGYGPAQRVATDAFYDRVRTAARMDGMMGYSEVAEEIAEMQTAYQNDGIDVDAGDALRALAGADGGPIVLYVGKLIVSKGVDLLAAAWPLVLRAHPEARLLVTGFGAYREGLEMLISALSEGDLVTARWIAEGGRAFEGGEAGPLKFLEALFNGLERDEDGRESYLEAARGMRQSITFVGRLEHDLLTGVIPAASCQVVPSTFPEAFGMVAAEAAACGVPPISADHSGLAEVTSQLQEKLSGASASLLAFKTTSTAVEQLASRIAGALSLSHDQRAEFSARLVQTAVESFSWAGVARELLAAAQGQSESLRRP